MLKAKSFSQSFNLFGMKLDIIYEDQSLVIVNKPSGLLTIPDRHDTKKTNVQDILARRYDKIYTVHRLDRETSGIICFARTAEAHAAMSQLFQERKVQKKYLAVVLGNIADDEGIIKTGLAPDPLNPGRMKVVRTGKLSVTTYKVLERFKMCCLVEAGIMTGRMHQIRVHFKSIGHPCYVDRLYGKNEAIYIRDIKLRNLSVSKYGDEQDIPLISRTSLHSHSLQFIHPVTGQEVIFEAPLPKDMKALVNQLRKWA